MRPSVQEHQLAVLDTQGELEVVMEYISNGAFLRTTFCVIKIKAEKKVKL